MPTGGVRKIYRFSEILNSHGLMSVVVHPERGHRYQWAPSDQPVVAAADVRLRSEDLLVVPELDVDVIWPAGVPKVVLNQNPHLMFGDQVDSERVSLLVRRYSDPSFVGVIVVSDHSEEMVRWILPDAPLWRVHLGIDTKIYYPGAKDRVLALMPRRLPYHAAAVVGALSARRLLDGWTVTSIDGRNEREVAEALRGAGVFLSFSDSEGFGLPPAEAMASGCVVVGYDGFGGRELFSQERSVPVTNGDLASYSRAVADVVVTWESATERWRGMAKSATDFVAEQYSPQRETADVLSAFSALMDREVVGSEAPGPFPVRSRPSKWHRAGYFLKEAVRAFRS